MTLFSIEPAGSCALLDGFLLAPLPARKGLWSAQDGHQWMEEKTKDLGVSTSFGLKLDGSMVKLENYSMLTDAPSFPQHETDSNESNWQEWCAGMDELGTLVMLVTSLTA